MKPRKIQNIFYHNHFAVPIFLLLLIVAAALRVYNLDAKSLWYDELHSIIPTNPVNTISSVIEYASGDQPPLFFIILYSWYNVFPYNEFSGKAFCAIIGIFGVAAMYFLGKEASGVRGGLVAMFLTAFNMFHIYYSQELRFYSLLFLMSVLSFLTFMKFIKIPSVRNQVLFVIATIGLLYTHYYGMVVAVSQAIIFLVVGIMNREKIIFYVRGIALMFVALIAFTPWIPIILKDSAVSTFWIEDPGPLFFAEYFSRYFHGWWALSFKYILNSILAIIGMYYLWLVISDFKNRQKDAWAYHVVIVGWLFFTLLIPYLYTVAKLPMLVDRYTLITLPAVLLMISLGWERIPNSYLRTFIAAAFIVCVVRVYNRYYNKFKKPEYRELSQSIIQQNENAYPVLSREAWHFNYFFDKYKAQYKVQHLDSLQEKWLEGKQGFWVIIPEHHMNDGQKSLIQSSFQVEKKLNFYGGMEAALYKRNTE